MNFNKDIEKKICIHISLIYQSYELISKKVMRLG